MSKRQVWMIKQYQDRIEPNISLRCDTIYVRTRSEITEHMRLFRKGGLSVFRTTVDCGCNADAKGRYAAFAIDPDTCEVKFVIVKCKFCKAKGNGTAV